MGAEEAGSRVLGDPWDAVDSPVLIDEGCLQGTLGDAGVGIAVVDSQGRCLDMNACFCELVGFSKNEMLGRNLHDLLPFDDAEGEMGLRRLLEGDIAVYRQEQRFLHSDGHPVWVLFSASAVPDTSGSTGSFVAYVQDISELKKSQIELEHRLLHDPLTGLPNRDLFADRLRVALARLSRHRSMVAVMFLDMDGFKTINDSLGYEAGDRVLQASAARLLEALRPGDTAARFGGDEFTILCEEVDHVRDVVSIAQRIQTSLTRPLSLDGREIFVSPSIGIAVTTNSKESPQSLIRDADTAMYHAKEGGTGRYQLFEQLFHHRAKQRLDTYSALHRAVEQDQLELWFQPQIRLDTGQIYGVEALVRWRHPDRGLLSPQQFIELAEETGLISAVGEWVLRESCSQAVSWAHEFPDRPRLMTAVNLSARQLARSNLPELIEDVLVSSGADPSRLLLEITESALIGDAETAALSMDRLRSLGVALGIDDFGTGFASLTYLKKLPVDVLKVHGSFVQGLEHNHGDRAIVRAVVDLGENLRLKVVAEGVETGRQLSRLRAIGFNLAQGFYFARPQPAGDISRLLELDPRW